MSKFKVLGKLFSKTDEAAQSLKREKGTGEEFLREIQKTPGVKPAEIKDRKLDKVLPAMGKTTKAEVLKKLEQNPPPKLQETVKGGMDTSDLDAYLQPDDSWNIRRISDQSFVTNVRGFGDDPEGAIQEAARRMSGEEGTKYGQYTIPGGENYREILLRLPVRPKDGVSVTQTGTGRWRVTFPDGSSDLYRTEQEAMANAGGRGSYHSTHWEEPNVLAHARVSDRVGPNGERILHVEEIQSDWHQQGRKQGYQDPNILEQKAKAEAARKAAQSVLDEAQEKVRAAKTNTQRYEGIINDPRFPTFPAEYQTSIKTLLDRYTKVWMDELPNLMKAQKEFDALPDPATMKTTGVPDAPFKKNWHELTMKRILDYAADKGYDKIAITPGAEQAKRYDLSKQIGKLEYDFGPADTVGHLKAYGLDGGRVIDRTVKPEELADYIGKEAAEKLIKTPAVNNTHMLEGVDLQVGGEGMKGFYDQILPTYLNDLGKPYGVKVGQMEVSYTPTAKQAQQGAADEALLSDLGVEVPQAPRPVLHTFDITPQMREEIKSKGLPLYQVAAPVATGAAAAAMEEPAAEPEYRKGGKVKRKVKFSTNPDAMRLEMLSRSR